MTQHKLSLSLFLALIGALWIPGVASAAAVRATPAMPWAGASVRLEVSGFQPRTSGRARLGGARSVRFRVGARGSATVVVRVPASVRAGLRTLRVAAGGRAVSTTLFVVPARRRSSTMVARSSGQRVLLDPNSGREGDRFTLKATGFSRRSAVDVRFGGESVARNRPSSRGAFAFAGSVPAIPRGTRIVRVRSGRTTLRLRFLVLSPLPSTPAPSPPSTPPGPLLPPPPPASLPPPPPPLASGVLAAAGDIACSPNDPLFNGGQGTGGACRQRATSDLLVGKGYSDVLTLGDTQYDCNTAADFAASFDPTWGRVKPIIRPVPGNHEYKFTNPDLYGVPGCTPDARGYFGYFGAAAGDPARGYYSFDIGSWHVIALNTNRANATSCPEVSCAAGSAQERWLRADLAANQRTCTLAFWHHPRFSSKTPSTASLPFWDDLYAAGADVVLNGHVHNYERFTPQRPDGASDPVRGIAQFVVGTGGTSLESIGTPAPGSNSAAATQTFGVLQLTLNPTSYEWRFVPEAGRTFNDAGSAACH